MYAANAGNDEAVRALLARGADANAKDKQSSTPLMFAAQGGYTQMVRMLLEAGADPNVRGTHGLTALGFAQQNGHAEAAESSSRPGAPNRTWDYAIRCKDLSSRSTSQASGICRSDQNVNGSLSPTAWASHVVMNKPWLTRTMLSMDSHSSFS